MQPQKKVFPKREKLNNYARFTGIAFQMIVIILAGVFGGIKMDKWLGNENHLFTAIFSLLAVILSIYTVIKDIIKK